MQALVRRCIKLHEILGNIVLVLRAYNGLALRASPWILLKIYQHCKFIEQPLKFSCRPCHQLNVVEAWRYFRNILICCVPHTDCQSRIALSVAFLQLYIFHNSSFKFCNQHAIFSHPLLQVYVNCTVAIFYPSHLLYYLIHLKMHLFSRFARGFSITVYNTRTSLP